MTAKTKTTIINPPRVPVLQQVLCQKNNNRTLQTANNECTQNICATVLALSRESVRYETSFSAITRAWYEYVQQYTDVAARGINIESLSYEVLRT